jgi:hypothetical protein
MTRLLLAMTVALMIAGCAARPDPAAELRSISAVTQAKLRIVTDWLNQGKITAAEYARDVLEITRDDAAAQNRVIARESARQNAIMSLDFNQPAPVPYTAAPQTPVGLPSPPPGDMTVTDPCAMMACTQRQAPQTPKFIPYTPGGGNPSGYGLLGD